MICKECNKEISGDFNFCPNCGAELNDSSHAHIDAKNSSSLICELCGDENDTLNRYCSGCGNILNVNARENQKAKVSNPSIQKHKQKAVSGKSRKSHKAQVETSSNPGMQKIYFIFAGVLLAGFILLYFGGVFDSPEISNNQNNQPAQSGPDLSAVQRINELQSKVDANANDLGTLLELAHTLHDNGFYERAIENYNKYLKVDATKPDVIIDAGVCYFNLNKFDDAIDWISKGLKLSPDHIIGNYNMGIVYLSKGDRDEAVKWFNKVISLAPNSSQAKQAKELIDSHL